MKRLFNIIVLLCTLLAAMSCNSRGSNLYFTTDDVADKKLAYLKGDLSTDEIHEAFPEADTKSLASASEMLMALSIWKFDAGVLSASVADKLITQVDDYDLLDMPDSSCTGIKVIVHKSRTHENYKEYAQSKGVVDQYLGRLQETILAGKYWKLILSGLLITVCIFISAWLLAMLLTIIIVLLGYVKWLKYPWKGVLLFIKTIHDVPSIVLIFFFYYVVFARTDTDAVFACIIALGIYATSSFYKVIHLQLEAIDPLQHKAAQMLGLKGWKKYRYVILPQAVKPMIPYLVSESKTLLRATTYAGYVSILDIVKVTELIRTQTYDTFIPLLFVSIVFLVLSWLITEGLHLSYQKLFCK